MEALGANIASRAFSFADVVLGNRTMIHHKTREVPACQLFASQRSPVPPVRYDWKTLDPKVGDASESRTLGKVWGGGGL